MAEAHLDHPGEVSWWDGQGPLPVIGLCPHPTCAHRDTRIVAYGPDWEHYELADCLDRAGCDGACRVWLAEFPVEARKPRLQPHGARQVRERRRD